MSATSGSSNPPPPPPPARLLDEFPPATYDAWKAQVEAELKGVPFDKKMFATTDEGITLRPIYRAEDVAHVPHLGSFPGFPPFVRGGRASGYAGQPWAVSQEITAASPAAFNDAARAYLGRGLTAINMVLDQATRNGADPDWAGPSEVGVGGLSIATRADLERALDGIDLERVPLLVRSGASGLPFAALLMAVVRRRRQDPAQVRGCIEIDPLGVLAHEGRLPQSLASAYREMAALTRWAAERAPGLETVCVHARAWHEAGGHAVQELAFTLATALEYFRALAGQGLGVDTTAPRMRLAFTVGSQFFMEIAKLRAARLVWARLVGVMGGSEDAQRARLHVRTSRWNKTVFDPYVNMLRGTVEAMAGVLGGCDSLQVGAFDEVIRRPDEFSERVARNTQLILQRECALDRVIDPAGGSWYVESLTDELARRAWGLFQEVEKRGGMAAALRQGWPQGEVSRVAAEKLKRVAHRRDGIVGTNQYANVHERRLERPAADPAAFHQRRVQQVRAARTEADEAAHAEVLARLAAVVGHGGNDLLEATIAAAAAGATLGEVTRAVRIQDQPEGSSTPVALVRAAAGFERLREAVEQHAARMDRRPRVFLANFGPPKQHRARADFARGVFEVAGLDVLASPGLAGLEEAVTAAAQSGAEAVCLCSSDETYPALTKPFVDGLRRQQPGVLIILAGYPADQVETLRASGVDAFVHLRADALAVLTDIVTRMGVRV